MRNTIQKLLIAATLIFGSQLIAHAQRSCMTVNLAESATANTNVQANVSIAGCVSPSDTPFVGITLNVSSNNANAASPVINPTSVSSTGIAAVQIAAHSVTTCTNVTLTFSTKVAGTTLTVTKTLMVCPFAFDIGVTGIAVNPAVAGQDSQVSVTVSNQGSQPLSSNYQVVLSTQEDTTNLVRNNCSTTQPPSSVGATSLPPLNSGQQQTITIPFRFPQAGNFNLVATASIGGSEDGPSTNNSRTQPVAIPIPRPLICEVTPQTTTPGAQLTIRGNWFKRLNSNDTPTVRIGNVNANVVNVVSPLEMTVSMPDLSCTASGRVSVAVSNPAGATSFENGPTFPAAIDITGSTVAQSCPGGQMTINVSGLRPNCGNPVVRLGNQNLQVVNTTANTITVQLPPTFPAGATQLTVQTTFGTDTINVNFLAPTISSTSLSRPAYSPPGTTESLTINLDHFRHDCTFSVTLEPGTTATGAPAAVGTAFSPQVLNSTANSIVVRVFQANTLGVWIVKVQTPYGNASKSVTLPAPSKLPGPISP